MLENALDNILAAKSPRKCGFGRWIDNLDADDRQRLIALLEHPDVAAIDIVDALAGDYTLAATTVRRHRRWLRDGTDSGCGCR